MSYSDTGHGAEIGQTSSDGHRVACLFETRAAAERASDDLIAGGIERSRIDIVDQGSGTRTSAATSAGEGGGLWDSIKRLFSGEEGDTYYEGVNRGQTLLTVHAASDAQAETAATILERHDPIDLDAQETSWRQSGWTGGARRDVGSASSADMRYAGMGETTGLDPTLATPGLGAPATAGSESKPVRSGATSESTLSGRAASPRDVTAGLGGRAEETIPVAEESLAVGKRSVQGGSVRVRTHVVTTPVAEDVALRSERVQVERRPVQGTTGAVTGDAFQERSIEMTETREEPVVSKTARVTEEVVVRKDTEERVEHVADQVRKTEVDVEDDRVQSGTARAKTGGAATSATTSTTAAPPNVAGKGTVGEGLVGPGTAGTGTATGTSTGAPGEGRRR